MKKKILVIGSLNIDQSIHVKEMPLEGQTIMGENLVFAAGGKGANQACAAGRLGADVTMLGCVGDDDFGRMQMESLRQAGVDISKLKVTKDAATGTAVIYVNERGNNCIVVAAGANQECDTAYLKENEKLFQEYEYILLQMEIPYDAVYYAIRQGKKAGCKVVLNPAPAPDSMPEDIWDKLHFITPNETELMGLTGMPVSDQEEIKKAAESLLAKGVENVLVTMGEKGVMVVNKAGAVVYPARTCSPVDTTAAGDTFNGGLLTALAEGRSVEEACRFGNTASSITVTRKGAQSSIPDREETLEQMKDFCPAPEII